jgi:decaprenylphospho-beta-D-erythro-pentofuranosid-2-ulose 2-reductase
MSNLLVLGATSDVAQALAHRFAAHGFNIVLAARETDRLASVMSDLEIRYNVQVHTVEFNALNYDDHVRFYDDLPEKPDVVACVFGYLGSQDVAQADFREAEKIIDTNYTGAVSVLNLVANDFEKRRSGSIIGISSVAGDRGRQSNYIYGSAKAAFTAYLSGLRNRMFKSNVHVMTVKPGFIRTKMTAGLPLPAPVTATPEQVASDVFRAYQKQGNLVYTLWMWQFIMLIIRHIPETIFKRLNL